MILDEENLRIKDILGKEETFSMLGHDTPFRRRVCTAEDSKQRYKLFEYYFMDSIISSKYMPEIPLHTGALVCRCCGKKISVIFDGEKFIDGEWNPERLFDSLDVEPVECSEIKDYSFEVDFPTGEAIITDDIRIKSDILRKEISLESYKGIKDVTLLYAKHNILHVFVSNTCPTVWEDADNKFHVSYLTEELEQQLEEQEIGHAITSITTDIWWGTIVDLEVLKSLTDETEFSDIVKKYKDCIFKIESGTYKVNYYITDDLDDMDCVPYKDIEFSKIK